VTEPAFDLATRPRNILGIDIENRPLWYGGSDFVYDLVFCVTCKYVGSPDDAAYTVLLDWSQDNETLLQLLEPLRLAIDECDSLLGHNFRHDWKGLVTLFNHLEQPPLKKKPVIDTMRCIPSGIPRSLDFLADKFNLGKKPGLSQHDWIQAIERRDPEKLALVKHRNRQDVLITERLYWKEKELGWL